MIDIVTSAFGAIVWMEAFLLYVLFSRQNSEGSQTLRRFHGLVVVSWSVLMLVETTYFMGIELRDTLPWLSWFSENSYEALRKLVFRPFQAAAHGVLIYYLLRRHELQPIRTAQVVMDWQGLIVSWNYEATNLLGWREEEAVGKCFTDLVIPEDLLQDGKPTREVYRDALASFRHTGYTPLMNTRSFTMVLRNNGMNLSKIPVEIMLSAHITERGITFLCTMTPRTLLG